MHKKGEKYARELIQYEIIHKLKSTCENPCLRDAVQQIWATSVSLYNSQTIEEMLEGFALGVALKSFHIMVHIPSFQTPVS